MNTPLLIGSWTHLTRHHVVFILVYLFPLSVAFAGTFNTTGRDIVIPVSLVESSTKLGNILISIGTEDAIAINSQELIAYARSALVESHIEALSKAGTTTSFFDEGFLAEFGYKIEFDSALLELHIQWPSRLKAKRQLTTRERGTGYSVEGASPNDTSAFVNLFAGLQQRVQGSSHYSHHSLLTESAVTLPQLNSLTIETETLSDESEVLSRLGTRLHYAIPDYRSQLSLGDLKTNSVSYLESPRVHRRPYCLSQAAWLDSRSR